MVLWDMMLWNLNSYVRTFQWTCGFPLSTLIILSENVNKSHSSVIISLKVFFLQGATAILGQGLFIIEDSWSHSDTAHSVGPLWKRYQPDAGISAWQLTTFRRVINASGGIRTHNRSKRAAADTRLWSRCHWDRHPAEVSKMKLYFSAIKLMQNFMIKSELWWLVAVYGFHFYFSFNYESYCRFVTDWLVALWACTLQG